MQGCRVVANITLKVSPTGEMTGDNRSQAEGVILDYILRVAMVGVGLNKTLHLQLQHSRHRPVREDGR